MLVVPVYMLSPHAPPSGIQMSMLDSTPQQHARQSGKRLLIQLYLTSAGASTSLYFVQLLGAPVRPFPIFVEGP